MTITGHALTRLVEFRPAFDRTDTGHGIHGAELKMVLKAPTGAVQFVLYTSRQLEHVQRRLVDAMTGITKQERAGLLAYSGPFPTEDLDAVVEEMRRCEAVLDSVAGCRDEHGFRTMVQFNVMAPLPADLGFHSPKPMYEGHEPIRHTLVNMTWGDPSLPFEERMGQFKPPIYGDPVICEYLEGDAVCYYDGSSLNAQPVYELLIHGGSEAAWAYLEEYWRHTFIEREE